MKLSRINYLVVILLFTVCSPKSYQLHINSSYFSSQKKIESQKSNIFSQANEDSTIEFSGIYSNKNLFLDKYPVFRLFDEQSGFFSIPLTDSINCQTDVLIKIKGKITPVPHRYPMIKKVSYHKHLSAISYEELNNLKNIKKAVNQEYLEIRKTLQKKITPKESKLQLVSTPEWILWYNKSKNILVFASHQHDLMYAADIEFIVDVETERITDVFAREWFKGE
ncbi:hypothetical protein H8E88_35720 [candidate division KSB1 bacterium]|nr:hypothetical protein [candidate division KSB1 bacterium]